MDDKIRKQFIANFNKCGLITEKVALLTDPDLLSLVSYDPNLILDFGKKILDEAKENHYVFFDQNLEGNLYHTLGRCHNVLSNFEDALREYTRALYCFQSTKNTGMEAQCLSGIGSIYEKSGDYTTSHEYTRNALEIALKTGNRELEARLMNDMGYTHVILGEYKKAMSYLVPSVQYLESSGNNLLLSFAKDSIARAYFGLGKIDEAMKYEMEAVALSRKEGNWYGVAAFVNFIGLIYYEKGKVNRALSCITSAQKLAKKRGYETEYATSNRSRGQIYLKEGHYEKAVESFQQAAVIAKRIHANRLLYEIYKELSNTAREMEDFEKALNYFELFHKLKETAQEEQENQEQRYRLVIDQAKKARYEADMLQIKNDELENEINERILLQQKLEILARTDPLTNLLNRRAFFIQAALAYECAIQLEQNFTLILFDIDNFKLINDTYGHQIGDLVLSKLGKRLLLGTRKDDLICRFGGEEFILLLQNTNLKGGHKFTKEIRELIKKPVHSESITFSITASFGIAVFNPAHPFTIDQLIGQADRAMYRSKKLGRDRITLYEERIGTSSLNQLRVGLRPINTKKNPDSN